ncbi:hypothetical protein FRC03_002066 [Tulasnella sp. 419]|nr:hypothetical protein FRC03_002066 [Tulasnella sp. 419]
MVLFARGVIAILETWPVLRLAVDNQWGGPESPAKRTWMASEIVDAFESRGTTLDQYDVEEMVLQAMAEEFETNVEDGTSTIVGRDIIELWKSVLEGSSEKVELHERAAAGQKGKKVQATVGEGNGDSDWEDDVDSDEAAEFDEAPELVDTSRAPRLKDVPEIDEEGFTLVKTKGRR